LACGTGVVASAIVAGLKGLVQSPVRCLTHGGVSLEVRYRLSPQRLKRPATHISLRGPVSLTFKGVFEVSS
jgi:diaminopimelate epimerase